MVSHINSEVADLETKLKKLYEEISKELLRDLQKYYGGILREVNLNEFVKELKGVMSEQGGKLGISAIVKTLLKTDKGLANRVVEAIARYISGLGIFATLDPEQSRHLAKLLNLDETALSNYLVEQRYMIVSPDNRELAEDIIRRISVGERRPEIIEVERTRTSFITYVRRRVAVPIQIKEVRDCLRAFFTKVPRQISKSIKELETVEEYRGKAYLTLDVNDKEFNEYLERVKKSLELFEARLGGRATA